MARTRKPTEKEDRYERRRENDRQRSRAYRERIAAARRPSSGRADRAIIMALAEVWAASIDKAGPDREARAAAMAQPISMLEVGGRAARWLARLDRADPEQARLAVLARMRPATPKRSAGPRDATRNGKRAPE